MVARVLNEAKVPVVVLNACQSGAIGSETGAAIARRLLQEGAASVVAMAYSVYATAAGKTRAACYERLFAGDRREALRYMIRAVSLFDDVPHLYTGAGPEHLAQLARELGVAILEGSLQETTGIPLPDAVREYVTSHEPDD